MNKKHVFYGILVFMFPWWLFAIGAAEMKSEYKDEYKHDNNNDYANTTVMASL